MISDERLAETIDELEPFNNLVQVVDGGDIKEFLIELQQRRAEKHDGADGAEKMYLDDICMNATYWRPQETDLPEGE